MVFQPVLPPQYGMMSSAQMETRIAEHKQKFGDDLVILGHHYQQDEVIQFADFTGDSLKLAKVGAEQDSAKYIVFCGVHFMAETADMLTDDSVKVILPDLSAGCSMADMADIDQLEDAWESLQAADPGKIIPITYVNSTAAIKAFCGGHDGACCTSSNARAVLEWAFSQGDRVLFLPDQHLGRNTAFAMGVPLEQMVVLDPHQDDGGLSAEQVRDARVLLWKGHCSVHELFTVEQCHELRRTDPEYTILVHPEVPREVVEQADMAGSTEFIIRTVEEAAPGSKWAIGTEVHLVNRLTARHPDKLIRSLAGMQCLCSTMYRIDLRHLLWCLDELAAGRVVNQITVDPEATQLAIIALNRMLANVTSQPVGIK